MMLTHLLRLLFIASSLLISISINCANVKTPSSQPDFAFPKQVSSDARLRLSKALDTHNGIGCLRAIIDLQLAQSMVDPDSTVAFMSRIATICNQTADPVIKSLLEILQARIYAEAYENDPKAVHLALFISRLIAPMAAKQGAQSRLKIMKL